MRKFFALALAVAMVLSLASVSFAATVLQDTFGTVYDYSGDKNQFNSAKSYTPIGGTQYNLGGIIEYGDTAYFILEDTNGVITDYEQVEKLKVKAEFEMGEDLVESVSIVKKNVDKVDNTPVNDYIYAIAVKIKKVETTSDADIVGTFEFNRKKGEDKNGGTIAKIKDEKFDFAINVWYDGAYVDASGSATDFTVSDDVTLKWDDKYVLKFSSDEEVTINFGTDENEGEFTVDVSGQGKLLVNYSTKANEAICAANEGAKLFFVNFNGVKFNRTGTFEYEMEDMVAAYEVVGDKLVEIRGLEIDGDVATFATRTLGNYVFADAELVNPVAEAPVVEAPAAVTNPSTGF